jgi:hypothetical protein
MNKLVLAAACLFAVTAFADDNPKFHTLPKNVMWVQPFGAKGPSFGVVQGKFADLGHPATLFIRFKAGADTGWHIHSEDYVGVVLGGTFSEQQSGEDESRLPTGSYFSQPGKKVHRNGCVSSTDCLVFLHFDKGADTTFTAPDGKPAARQAPPRL